MEGNIRLNNPQEVLAYISREAELLNQYAELINQEAQELSLLETLVSETMQLVNQRKRNAYVAIEQMKRYEDSDAKQRALRELQKKMEQYEEQARMVNQCNDDLMGIRQDYMSVAKESTAISDTAKVLSGKCQQLIERIVDAI